MLFFYDIMQIRVRSIAFIPQSSKMGHQIYSGSIHLYIYILTTLAIARTYPPYSLSAMISTRFTLQLEEDPFFSPNA